MQVPRQGNRQGREGLGRLERLGCLGRPGRPGRLAPLLPAMVMTLAVTHGSGLAGAQGLLDDLGTHDPWSRLIDQNAPNRDAALAEALRTADRSACNTLFSIYSSEPGSTGLLPALIQAFGRLGCQKLRAHLEARASRGGESKGRDAALMALGRLRHPGSMTLLESIASTGQAPEQAVMALRLYGDPAIPALLRLARSGGAAVPHAIQALTRLRAPGAGQILRDGLSSGAVAPAVALPALCSLEGPRALPVILPWLSHPDPNLRLATLEALEGCADSKAAPALVASLAEPLLRPLALKLLANLGVEAPVSPLLSLLARKGSAPGAGSPPIERALGRTGGKEAAPILAALLERAPHERSGEALDALQHTGSPLAARILRRAARRGDQHSPRAMLRLGSLLRGAGIVGGRVPLGLRHEAEAAMPEL
ncbi:MAG: hypothetical protein RBU30_26105, partial [Polyangia bacterium]|nr:hypothetical protein [Polyangia bacterium]